MSQSTDNQRVKNSKTKKSETDARPRRQNIFRRILQGNVLTSDFFVNNWLKILVVMVFIVIYISTKYQCLTSMETIKKLENELEVVKTESIRERSNYMSRIRESSMAELADSIRPGLRVQEHPPYVLKYPATGK